MDSGQVDGTSRYVLVIGSLQMLRKMLALGMLQWGAGRDAERPALTTTLSASCLPAAADPSVAVTDHGPEPRATRARVFATHGM